MWHFVNIWGLQHGHDDEQEFTKKKDKYEHLLEYIQTYVSFPSSQEGNHQLPLRGRFTIFNFVQEDGIFPERIKCQAKRDLWNVTYILRRIIMKSSEGIYNCNSENKHKMGVNRI